MKRFLYIIKKQAFNIFAAAFLVAYYLSSKHITKAKPMMFPKFLMVCVAIVLAINIVKSLIEAFHEIREGKGEDMPSGAEFWSKYKKQIFVVLTLVIYVFLIKIVGFYVMTFIYIFGVSYYLGLRKLTFAIPSAICITGVFYLLFKVLLSLRLPAGFLF